MKNHKNILFFLPAVGLGLAGLMMRLSMIRNGLDEKGLLIPGHYSILGLWGVSILFFGVLALLLRQVEDGVEYRSCFPASRVRGLLSMVAGALMAVYWVPASQATADLVLGMAAGGIMIFTGLCRVLGWRPNFLMSGLLCVGICAVLLRSYSQWRGDSQIQDYACQMLALVMMMLFSFHRSCCDGGLMCRRKLVFTGFSALYLSLVCLGDTGGMFFLAAGMWIAGSLCDMNPGSPAPAEAEECDG